MKPERPHHYILRLTCEERQAVLAMIEEIKKNGVRMALEPESLMEYNQPIHDIFLSIMKAVYREEIMNDSRKTH